MLATSFGLNRPSSGHIFTKLKNVGGYNIVYTFNKYFLSIAEKITCDIRYKNSKGCKTYKSPTHYLSNLFHKPFPSIQFNNTSTKEIDKIIKD